MERTFGGQRDVVGASIHSPAPDPGSVRSENLRLVPDPPSFESIFRAQYAGVVRLVRGLGVSGAEAEDVAQAVFMVVHRRLADYDPSRPARAWILGIARRVVKDHMRARSRARAREQGRRPMEARTEDPAAFAERGQAISLVERILATMKEEWRLPFVLTEIEGYTAPEIAEALGWKLPTVYTRLRRARLHFETERRKLQPEEAPHG